MWPGAQTAGLAKYQQILVNWINQSEIYRIIYRCYFCHTGQLNTEFVYPVSSTVYVFKSNLELSYYEKYNNLFQATCTCYVAYCIHFSFYYYLFDLFLSFSFLFHYFRFFYFSCTIVFIDKSYTTDQAYSLRLFDLLSI